jgi:hypothetical protein
MALDGLCGNKNVQKVLLFLFVNNKCYGAQLQRLLRTPLTSLQNALARLEKGRVIMSYLAGKTRLYQLNPAYPLLPELEQLLKKAYTLLPPQDKKLFSLLQQEAVTKRVQEPLLLGFWDRLKTVQHLNLHAKSHSKQETGWNGVGKGDVLVIKENETTLVFQERGAWQIREAQEIAFSNTFRWTLDRSAGMISLEHLRLGPNAPVFLFHLTPTASHLLASVDSHLCEEDAYLAQVMWDQHRIQLRWRVIGPRKNEEMEYHYF